MPLEAFFLPVASGRLFCLLHKPDVTAATRGAVIYVHPFAEEMNKSRRMAAMQARAMAAAGYAVLQVDLLGCGDSSGDFGDVSWATWIDNLVEAARWFRERTEGPLYWWGLRVGALLAVAAANAFAAPSRLLLWQPVMLGKQYLQQFLRLKVAGELLEGANKGVMNRLKAQLADGLPVEVAGYMLAPALAAGLEKAELTIPGCVERVALIEIAAVTSTDLSPAARTRLDQWRDAGVDVRGLSVAGPAFWQTTEIEECPALIDLGLQALSEMEMR